MRLGNRGFIIVDEFATWRVPDLPCSMPFDHFRMDFICRISEDRDSNRSCLYVMPTSDIAVGVAIIVGMPGCVRCRHNNEDSLLAIQKLWLCVYERLLSNLYKR
jgi:hypothetical protein